MSRELKLCAKIIRYVPKAKLCATELIMQICTLSRNPDKTS